MRLSSLKLSGFKSFADSTTLHFKENRTAVVGPNGCGKSNVIDAIRWVMGESNARQLRGGSMQDVIFTGTAKRKPVGMASVELRFDNTYGQLGGTYNAYTELAVRRQVTREGKSEYFLNGTKCRRRDITDIFLGTGLGPRSYAIIEQGMINRLVDAKPEEMRVYIEEAAGVSRYQARRRETLQHLEHTTHNLSRLEDISSELKAQLKTLKKQAEAALVYQELEQQIFHLKVDILSVQAMKSTRLQAEYTVELTALGERYNCVRHELTTIEHELEHTHALFQRLISQSTPLQQQWQQAEQQLSALNLELQTQQNTLTHYQNSLEQLDVQKQQYKQQIQQLELQQENLHEQEQQLTQEQQDHQYSHKLEQNKLQQLKAKLKQAEEDMNALDAKVKGYQQQQQQYLLQSEQLTKNIARFEQQQQVLQQQLQQIQQQADTTQLQEYIEQLQQCRQQDEHNRQKIHELNEIYQTAQNGVQQSLNELQHINQQMQILQAEQKHLRNLVAKTSSTSASVVHLVDQLKLSEGAKPYAILIEKCLATWLSASMVNEFGTATARQLKQQSHLIKEEKTLADWIAFPQSSLWQNIMIVDDLKQALAQQNQLLLGQSILTLDGYHLGPDWMIALDYDEQSQSAQGSLSHRLRLEDITKELVQYESQNQQLEQALEQQKATEHSYKQQLKLLRDDIKQQHQIMQDLELSIAKINSAQHAFQIQHQQVQQQLEQVHVQLQEDLAQKDELTVDLQAGQIKLEQHVPLLKTAQGTYDEACENIDQQYRLMRSQQQQHDDLNKQTEQLYRQIALLNKDLKFSSEQLAQIQNGMQDAQQKLIPAQESLPKLQHESRQKQQLAQQLKQQWEDWQQQLNQVQTQQSLLTQKRQQHEQKSEQLRAQLESKRLAWQTAKTDLEHYQEQLAELDAIAQTELNIDIDQHQHQLSQAQQRLQKIGAVNLTASAEYQEVLVRYQELNHQMDDLNATVDQLQAAIKSIDQETRKLFMHTFDQINRELQNLFPKVFNGGEASLSLEDDWQSGVKLMARPPGKRNSSLALLSGGEKALTALSLVFAIFRLNPAPFCVLDEVDAPLDDANVAHFCNLVKELSEQVQFIYITHNKLAMTMATDLLGVTMPEAGTSKLVAVNLEQAKEYSLAAES